MKLMVPAILFAVGCTVGCTGYSPAPVQGQASATNEASEASPAAPASGSPAMLFVQLNKLDEDGDETTEFVRTFEAPGAALIAEQVKSLDWQNPKHRNDVRVAFKITQPDQRDAMERKGTLSIDGGLKNENKDGLLKATWQGDGLLVSRPLESLDQAIALLVSFRNEDEKWRTMVEWTTPQ